MAYDKNNLTPEQKERARNQIRNFFAACRAANAVHPRSAEIEDKWVAKFS